MEKSIGFMEVYKNKEKLIHILILVLFIIFTRIFFFIDFFNDWDPINFALALKKFDIFTDQPHPPGYPAIVLLGKFINLFARNELISLQIISLILSILSVIIFYLFLNELIKNSFYSFLYTLIFSISPIFFYYGTTPDVYTAEAFVCLIFSFFAYLTLKNDKFLYPFVIVYGLIGSFRFNDTIFFFPFFLLILFLKKVNFKELIKISVLLIATTLIWYIPVNIYVGGFKNYSFHSKALYIQVLKTSLILDTNYWQNVTFKTFIIFIKDSFIPLSLIFIFINKIKKEIWYFIVLTLPPLIFYFFIHAPKPGYYLTIIPIVYLLFFHIIEKVKLKKVLIIVLSICLIFNSLILFKNLRENLIKNIDIEKKVILEVKNYVINDETCIFVSDNTLSLFRHLMWYIPESYVYLITPVPTTLYINKNNIESGYTVGKNKEPYDIVISKEISLNKNIKRIIILTTKYEKSYDFINLDWIKNIEFEDVGYKIYLIDIDNNFEYIFLKGYKIFKK